jgi:hypothetical protein
MILASGLLGLLLATSTRPAMARSEAEIAYTRDQTFSAALRYLRVDLAYEVTEKDAEAAYLLFSFSAPELNQKTARGSIEVVQRERTVRLLVNLPELPSYREEVLKRGLLDKLLAEYGEPPAAAAEPRKPNKGTPQKPAPDAQEPPPNAPEPAPP